MPVLVQVCIVLSTLALLVFAATSLFAAMQLRKAAKCLDRSAAQIEDAAAEARRVGAKVRDLAGNLQQVAESARSTVRRFEHIGARAATVSGLVLDEVERPVRRMAAMMEGVRTGAGVLMERWSRRSHAAASNGGFDHEQ